MLCDRIKEERIKHGYTQAQMGRELGITQTAYSYFESGDRIPSIAVLKAIAHCFDVTTDYLLEMNEEK